MAFPHSTICSGPQLPLGTGSHTFNRISERRDFFPFVRSSLSLFLFYSQHCYHIVLGINKDPSFFSQKMNVIFSSSQLLISHTALVCELARRNISYDCRLSFCLFTDSLFRSLLCLFLVTLSTPLH